jgi:hypothetical protein
VTAIPLADAGALRRPARRTEIVRAALAGLLVAAIVAVALVSRHPHVRASAAPPGGTNAIVVLDLSASIASRTYSQIGATLSSFAHSRGRYGLILFSDTAYQALPPGTPAADLVPFTRYFSPLPGKNAFGRRGFPANPWQNSFTGGTQISSGLVLARAAALAQPARRPAVVLVSDLDDDPTDLRRLTAVLLTLRRERIPVHVVGLDPSAQNAAFFQRLVGAANPVLEAGTTAVEERQRDRAGLPWQVVVLALSIAAVLAAHALWGPRLRWAKGLSGK